MSKPYSVLLLYPEDDNEGGVETFYTHVNAEDYIAAARKAQREAIDMNEWGECEANEWTAQHDLDDFHVLLVLDGHHMDLWTPEDHDNIERKLPDVKT